MLTTWIARKEGCAPKYLRFNRLNDIEYNQAVDWRLTLETQGYKVRVKLN